MSFTNFLKKYSYFQHKTKLYDFSYLFLERELSHPYFLQTYDVSDCGCPKYGETRPFSTKTNRKHLKIRLCADTYTLGDI